MSSTSRPTYDEDKALAEAAGFDTYARIHHYSGGLYRITGHVLISDNSKYDGRLGIVYEKWNDEGFLEKEPRTFCRPFAQMIEPHVHGDDFVQKIRFEPMELVPMSVLLLLAEGFNVAGDGGMDPFNEDVRDFVSPWIKEVTL